MPAPSTPGRRRISSSTREAYDAHGRVVGVLGDERRHAAGQDCRWTEAGVHAEQLPETRQQQPGAHEQDEGQRDLRHRQAAPHVARRRLAVPVRPLSRSTRLRLTPLRCSAGTTPITRPSSTARPPDEGNDGAVEPHFVTTREIGERESREAVDGPVPDEQPERRAHEGQHQRLGDQLTNDPAAARRQGPCASPAPSCGRWPARAPGS